MSIVGVNDDSGEGIAIVGIAGRFPGANTIDMFWRNLRDGVESVSFFSEGDLIAAKADLGLLRDPHYVKAKAILDDVELFDARFFGFSAREAEIMDPQQRLFLECAWEALENAGYDTNRCTGRVGVYAGASISTYLFNLYSHGRILETVGVYQTLLANDKDHLTTRVSYKLNLRGPSFTVQTACSTSLVAIHVACQSLLTYQCDIALAGGVTISLPQISGYLYQKDGILSPDGHCRAFDVNAKGTVSGNGLGIVVLKRLCDAFADGDYIYAVIKGSAINNDGSTKVGYTAPSVNGQIDVIAEALADAGVDPATISYVEAHGTGTILGDPIEITALTQVFGARTDAKGFCAVGSVKTNIGHLDAAAGVAGLIKTVLALKHKTIPPSLHFQMPNANIDFADSPFYVNSGPMPWEAGDTPRRAGVSSFGIGGTNAHVVLEEAPPEPVAAESRPWYLLTLSAMTPTALATMSANFARYLREQRPASMADVAYVTQVGRRVFPYRRVVVCRDADEAIYGLETLEAQHVFSTIQEEADRSVVFLFPGQGVQHVGMTTELYQSEPAFRTHVDRCAELLLPHLGRDLREVLYPRADSVEEVTRQLNQTSIAQPALFVVEYALAQLWMEWGVRPEAMLGHSIGEYVAACLSGVFSLEEALWLVAIRGRLMWNLSTGSMLSVPLSEEQVRELIGSELCLAASNGPALCVVSGPHDAIAALRDQLTRQGVETRLLHTSHAFHSAMMEPILEPFAGYVRQINLKPPQIPYISNMTGAWITDTEATDPEYWAKHLRHTVRFADGMQTLLAAPGRIFLEVGPGQTLSTLARRQEAATRATILESLPRQSEGSRSDGMAMLTTLGKLWLSGVTVDWPAYYAHERRRRVPLPTYPFERQRYWIEANTSPILAYTERSEVGDDTARAPALDLHPRPGQLNAYVAPRSEIEQLIAQIWQETLGVDQVGIYDNFFDLGGHSLLATQLASRLREAFPVEIALRPLLEKPTVVQMAEEIEELFIARLEELPEDEAERLAASLLQ